jgi:hypothetical protein
LGQGRQKVALQEDSVIEFSNQDGLGSDTLHMNQTFIDAVAKSIASKLHGLPVPDQSRQNEFETQVAGVHSDSDLHTDTSSSPSDANDITSKPTIATLDHLSQKLPLCVRRKARLLLLKLVDNPVEFSWGKDNVVTIAGTMIPNSNINELLAATFNSRKKAEGLDQFLELLSKLDLLNLIHEKRKVLAASTVTGNDVLPIDWFFIGP